MRRYPRLDANHNAIAELFTRCGAKVQSLAYLGGGVPDLLIGAYGRLALVEVKDGTRAPSERKLTPQEAQWHQTWCEYPVFVVKDDTDALAVLKALQAA